MGKLAILSIILTLLSNVANASAYSNINWEIEKRSAIAYCKHNILTYEKAGKYDLIDYQTGKSIWGNKRNQLQTLLEDKIISTSGSGYMYTIYDDYLVSMRDEAYCYRISTGELLWQDKELKDCFEPYLFDSGFVYFGYEHNLESINKVTIIKVNLVTAEKTSIVLNDFPKEYNNICTIPFRIYNECIYFDYLGNWNYIACYSLKEEKTLWTTKFMPAYPRGWSSHYYISNDVLAVTYIDDSEGIDNYYVVGFDCTNGKELWRTKASNYVVNGDQAYVVYTKDKKSKLSVINIHNGEIQKEIGLTGQASSLFDGRMQRFKEYLYILTYDEKGIATINILNEKTLSSVPPISMNNTIFSFDVYNFGISLCGDKVNDESHTSSVYTLSILNNLGIIVDILKLLLH